MMQKSHSFGFDDGNKMKTSPQSRFVKISNQERKGSKHWGLEGRDFMGKITFSMDVNIETGTYTYVDEKTQKLYSNDPALQKHPNYAGKLPEADIKRLQKMTNRASEQIKQNQPAQNSPQPSPTQPKSESHTFGFDDGNKMETSPQSRFVKISNQERKGSKHWGLEGRDFMGKITFSMDVNIETGTYTYVDEKTQKLYSNDPALQKHPNYAGKLPEADIKRLQKMTNRASEQIKQNRNTPTKKANLQELRNGYNRNLDTKPQPTETKGAKETQSTSKVLTEIIRRHISGRNY